MKDVDLLKAAQNVVHNCLQVRQTERVVVVAEEDRFDIVRALIHPILKLGAEITVLPIFQQWRNTHGELGRPVQLTGSAHKLLESADVIISLVDAIVGEAGFRKSIVEYAHRQPCRVAHMPGVMADDFRKYLGGDSRKILQKGKYLEEVLLKHVGQTMQVKTKAGTNVVFEISDKIFNSSGIINKPHLFGNLPAGEVYFVPEKSSANGHVVIDLSLPGRVLKGNERLEFDVENGIISRVERRSFRVWAGLEKILERPGANVLAEIGIGLNEEIKTPTGRELIDEKMAKTMHFGIGDNTVFGGWNESEIHLDLVFGKPTVKVGGKEIIIREGELSGGNR